MKKLFWHKRNALIPTGAVATASVVFLLGAVLLILRFFSPGTLSFFTTPLFTAGNVSYETTRGFFSLFENASSLVRERDALVVQNEALLETNRALTAEVADVTKLVGTRPESAHRILSGVLAHPPVSPYDTLIIDTGSTDGVVPEALVYGPGSTPIGTIESSTAHSARVSLYSAPGRLTAGWVGEKKIAITVMGGGAGTFTATLPRESGVVVGDVLYLPGPGALPVGSIVRIDTDPSSPRDIVHIAPYTNLFSLTWVEVAPRP